MNWTARGDLPSLAREKLVRPGDHRNHKSLQQSHNPIYPTSDIFSSQRDNTMSIASTVSAQRRVVQQMDVDDLISGFDALHTAGAGTGALPVSEVTYNMLVGMDTPEDLMNVKFSSLTFIFGLSGKGSKNRLAYSLEGRVVTWPKLERGKGLLTIIVSPSDGVRISVMLNCKIEEIPLLLSPDDAQLQRIVHVLAMLSLKVSDDYVKDGTLASTAQLAILAAVSFDPAQIQRELAGKVSNLKRDKPEVFNRLMSEVPAMGRDFVLNGVDCNLAAWLILHDMVDFVHRKRIPRADEADDAESIRAPGTPQVPPPPPQAASPVAVPQVAVPPVARSLALSPARAPPPAARSPKDAAISSLRVPGVDGFAAMMRADKSELRALRVAVNPKTSLKTKRDEPLWDDIMSDATFLQYILERKPLPDSIKNHVVRE